jgi:hypothetical protein
MTAEWTPWKVEYLRTGWAGPRQGPGWYATRAATPPPPGRGTQISAAGPFDSEAEAREWAAKEDGVPPESVPLGNTPDDPSRDMRLAGERAAAEREKAFLDATPGGAEKKSSDGNRE